MITEIDLPDAAFGNMAPYQWAGSTDFDISYDECGLWVIYATLQNSLDIGNDNLSLIASHDKSLKTTNMLSIKPVRSSLYKVISKLDPKTLEILETHRTNWRKQWSGNAFMACGVMYVLKKEFRFKIKSPRFG